MHIFYLDLTVKFFTGPEHTHCSG